MLVVLGHLETMAREETLEIGSGAILARADITKRYVSHKDAPPPLVILIACASAAPNDTWGGLPTAFASQGAAAVVATFTKLNGPQGATAASEIARSLSPRPGQPELTLGRALMAARRDLVDQGLLLGLLLVAHGEIDLPLR